MGEAPALAELQRQMLAAIRGEAQSEELDAVAAHLTTDHRLSGAGRLGIYADMYFWRLVEVLRGAFPRLLVFLGDDAFAALCARYLAVHPSRHPSLRFLGDRLAGFMRAEADDAGVPPWTADLAALEWARYDVFDEADADPLTLAALRARPPEAFADLPVRLAPAHRWLQLDHTIETTWRALTIKAKAPSVDLTPPARQPRTLLVWRQANTVYHRALEGEEAEVLALARPGTSFGIICETLAACLEASPGVSTEAAAKAAFSLLARWVDDGLLAA